MQLVRRNSSRRKVFVEDDDEGSESTVRSSSGITSCPDDCKSEASWLPHHIRLTPKREPLTRGIPFLKRGDLDELSVASSLTFPAALSKEENLKRMERQAEIILADIRGSLAAQTQQAAELDEAYAVHLDRAKARWAAHNAVGAVLSMKKVNRCQAERERLSEATKYLKSQEAELVNRMQEARAMTALQGGNEEGFSTFSVVGPINYDVSTFSRCCGMAEEIRAPPGLGDSSSSLFTDEELLDELRALSESPAGLERTILRTRIEI